MIYGFLGIGFVLLLAGSEAVSRGGARLFRALGLPPIFVCLFVATFAMSAPELSVAVQANLRNHPDIALGVIVGSTIANLLLVFGAGALAKPVPCPPRTVFRDGGVLIASCIVVVIASVSAFLSAPFGVVLVAGWLGYLVLAFLTEWGRAQPGFDAPSSSSASAIFGLFFVVIGGIGIFFGARFAVDFSVVAAQNLHVTQAAIALTLVALATALPELVAVLVSAGQGHSHAISTQIIASCIFNLLLVLGVSAIARPMSVPAMVADFDGPVMAACAILVTVLMLFGWRLTRVQGLILLLAYLGYAMSVAARSGLHFGS